jgi:hypothetical protein
MVAKWPYEQKDERGQNFTRYTRRATKKYLHVEILFG